MPAFADIIAVWFGLNLVIPAVIFYQRSPNLRHRFFRWTVGGLAPLHDRRFAHVLVVAAHRHR